MAGASDKKEFVFPVSSVATFSFGLVPALVAWAVVGSFHEGSCS